MHARKEKEKATHMYARREKYRNKHGIYTKHGAQKGDPECIYMYICSVHHVC